MLFDLRYKITGRILISYFEVKNIFIDGRKIYLSFSY
jgi:hypothetical protein